MFARSMGVFIFTNHCLRWGYISADFWTHSCNNYDRRSRSIRVIDTIKIDWMNIVAGCHFKSNLNTIKFLVQDGIETWIQVSFIRKNDETPPPAVVHLRESLGCHRKHFDRDMRTSSHVKDTNPRGLASPIHYDLCCLNMVGHRDETHLYAEVSEHPKRSQNTK